MRRIAGALLVIGSLTFSCAEDAADSSPDPKGSGDSTTAALVNDTLPDNLCDEVLPAVPVDYGVEEVAHTSAAGSATCSLATESGATTLEVTLTLAEPAALEDAFAVACGALEPQDQQERRCTARSDQEFAQAASLATRSGVLLMRLHSDDPERIRTAGIDLALVESAVASA